MSHPLQRLCKNWQKARLRELKCIWFNVQTGGESSREDNKAPHRWMNNTVIFKQFYRTLSNPFIHISILIQSALFRDHCPKSEDSIPFPFF